MTDRITERMADTRSEAAKACSPPWAAIPGLQVMMALSAGLGACDQPRPVRVMSHANGQQQFLQVAAPSALSVGNGEGNRHCIDITAGLLVRFASDGRSPRPRWAP